MKGLYTKITLLLIFGIILGCQNDDMENKLRKRIDGVYQAWKEKNFEQLLDFGSPEIDKTESRRERLDEIKKMYPVLVNYKIREIKITKNRARVRVTTTVILDNNKEDVADEFDYWIFENNEWYLLDFGKII
jgi:uncharacterized protein YchJ